MVENQKGEGTISSPCDNIIISNKKNNNNNNNNNHNNNNINNNNKMGNKINNTNDEENQMNSNGNFDERERSLEKCECPNSQNITWNLEVADGLRYILSF